MNNQQWFSAKEIAIYTGETPQGINKKATNQQWKSQPRKGKGGGREYHMSSLPSETRQAIAANAMLQETEEVAAARQAAGAIAKSTPAAEKASPSEAALKAAALNGKEADRADAKLEVIRCISQIKALGSLSWADAVTAYNNGSGNVSQSTETHYPKVSLPSFTRWRKALEQQGPAALAGNYGNRRGQSVIDSQPELKAFVIAFITNATSGNHNLLMQACEARFSGSQTQLPSISSLRRWVNNWKTDNAELLMAITAPDQYKNKAMLAHGSADGDIHYLNQRWESDATPADIMCTDGRHSIVGIIDIYSGRAHLLVAKTSKAETVMLCVRHGLLNWGKPDELLVDNGQDFKSKHVERILLSLDINKTHTNPFSGWEKPFIERLFRSFSHNWLELAPGFVGHNVSEREALRARKSFSDRLFKKNSVIEAEMTGAELQTLCNEWINNHYMHQAQKRLGNRSPFQMVTNWREPVPSIDNPAALDLLLAKAPGNDGIRTISKKGISHQGRYYIHPQLAAHPTGTKVQTLCDPADIGRLVVFIQHPKTMEYICTAECPELTGINEQEWAATAKKIQTARVQSAKAAAKAAAKKIGTDDILQEIRNHAAEKTAHIVSLPGPTQGHQTPALSAAADAIKSNTPAARNAQQEQQHQAAMASIKTAMQRPTDDHGNVVIETAKQRYERWLRYHASIENGAELSPQQQGFYNAFKNTPEYEAQHALASGKFAVINL